MSDVPATSETYRLYHLYKAVKHAEEPGQEVLEMLKMNRFMFDSLKDEAMEYGRVLQRQLKKQHLCPD